MKTTSSVGRAAGTLLVAALTASCGGAKKTANAPEKPPPAIPVRESPSIPAIANLPDCLKDHDHFPRPTCWAVETGDGDDFVKFASALTPRPRSHSNSAA